MSDTPLGNRNLESVWKHRLVDAKQRLDFSHAYIVEIEHDDSSGGAQVFRWDAVYEQALRAAVMACDEYCTLVKIYVALVAYGQVPDETEWRRLRHKGWGASPK